MVIEAKFRGTCKNCGRAIAVGEKIEWTRGAGARHVTCPVGSSAADASAEGTIQIGGGSGYGYEGWSAGEVIRHPRGDRRPETEPEYLVVLTASQRYYREEGLSFGVGDESGYAYSATCRPATEAEAAPLVAARTEAQARRQAKADLEAIGRLIQETGERPEGPVEPAGERLHDTQTLYGGGDWYVIGPEWIWFVRNNGADGDDWSHNNVRTGGAGAIGWRVPFATELAEKIRSLLI